jgi:DNA polymerase-4
LRLNDLKGKTINLKIKLANFKTLTRSLTLDKPTNFSNKIFEVSKELFFNLALNKEPIRLIGVSVSKFDNNFSKQNNLFQVENANLKNEKIYQALDKIKNKFGEESVRFNLKK